MKLSEVIEPARTRFERVIDATTGAFDLRRYLDLEQDVSVIRTGDAGALTGTDLIVTIVGDDPDIATPVEALADVLEEAPLGAILLVLSPVGSSALPVPELLQELTSARFQALRVSPLHYERLRTAVLAERVERLRSLVDPLAQTRSVRQPDETRLALRAANETAFATFLEREIRARYAELDRTCDEAAAVDRSLAELRGQVASLGSERTELTDRVVAVEAELEQRISDLADAQYEVERLEQSTTHRVGQAFVRAARKPASEGLKLPVRLVRLWSSRAERSGPVRPDAPRPRAIKPNAAHEVRRYMRFSDVSIDDGGRLNIAGVVSAVTEQALGHDATVNRIRPHDAVTVVRATQPDVLLIESAAALPGSSWYPLGEPGMAERDAQIAEVVAAAQEVGAAIAFWRNTPPTHAPGFESLVGGALHLHEVAWDHGVPLWLANPVGGSDRVGIGYTVDAFQLDGASEAQELERLLANRTRINRYVACDDVLASERVASDVRAGADLFDPLRRFAYYRRHERWISDRLTLAGAPSLRTLEQVASGASVIGQMTDVDELDAVVGPDCAPQSQLPVEVRARALRWIDTHRSTTTQLHRLVELLELDTTLRRRREVTAVCRPRNEEEAHAIISTILDQTHRPTEVVWSPAKDGLAEPTALIGENVTVHRGDPTTPFVIRWTAGSRSATWLHDLLLGWEMSRADVVLDVGTDWRFVTTGSPVDALLERQVDIDLPLDSEDLDAATSRGMRVFAVPERRGAT